ncbi:MAG: peptidoglycan DD-metalloendopeptidase family protein [Patescibacteria group bacterium]|nr:peptidoglycan DD-metalloendopeptidase family protein [Patescibacteria group bacterium]
MAKVDRLTKRVGRTAVKTKVGYENLDIEGKVGGAKEASVETWKQLALNLKTMFFKPVRQVSHFGLIAVILVVLISGIPAPESMVKSDEIPVDPFGMIASQKAYKDEEVDVTELEAVAMAASFIDDGMANKVYEEINNNQSDSQIVLAGNTIANSQIISTESSAKLDSKWEKYVVRSGDTLSGIATKFGVTTNSIKWSNSNVKDIDSIKPGVTLYIPTVTGIIYKVKKGDTIDLIAAKYKSKSSLIVSYNDLYGEDLVIGETIIIPNGQKSEPKPVQTPTRVASTSSGSGRYGSSNYIGGSGSFRFPCPVGRNGYYNGYHWWAIDIPGPIGTPIYAADSGRIVEARYGWNGGFGNTILIDHGNGFQTRYAHMTTLKILGGYVSKGQTIGYMGSTGRSTGSHLHFEILRNGARVNPMYYF